jgi:hypothetical protein
MKLIRYALALCPILPLMASVSSPHIGKNINKPIVLDAGKVSIDGNSNKYAAWNLSAYGLSERAFDDAIKGYTYLLQKKMLIDPSVLTIIDYSKPSTQKRLYVLDMNTGKILFNTLVAHGRNSGYNYATDFSNDEDSHKSSLGFYITLNTYTGTNGYSLKLKGCEKGINDKATDRAIVLHGAEYVSESFIRTKGYLGRSYGCPAIPLAVHKKIIDKLKGGTCLFLYHPTKSYSTRSKILDS